MPLPPSTELLASTPAARLAEPKNAAPATTLLADGGKEVSDLSPKKRKEPFSRKRLAFKESSSFGGKSNQTGAV